MPSVVLMNPPFSVMANVSGRMADAAYRHVASALARLAPGGRLVAITGASFAPDTPAWRDAFVRLQERGRVVFTAAIDGSVYAKHGTTIDTRLTVIDKAARRRPDRLSRIARHRARCGDAAWPGSSEHVPPRAPVALPTVGAASAAPLPEPCAAIVARAARGPTRGRSALPSPTAVELAYETVDWTPPEGAPPHRCDL